MALDAPQIVNLVTVAITAVTMLVLARRLGMLAERRPRPCAACGRLVEPGRRCVHCG